MNSPQITEAFKADLAALLKRWGATLEAEDHYQGYPECGEDVRMTVTVSAVYAPDGSTFRQWTEIDLGRHFSPP